MKKIKEKIKASIYLLSYFETLGFKNGQWEFNYNFRPPTSVEDIAFQNITIIHHFFSLGGFEHMDITGWNSSDDTIMSLATSYACIKGGTEEHYINEYVSILDQLKDTKRQSGNNTLNTLEFVKRARSIDKIKYDKNMGGNGAAMRTSPIGLIYYKEEDLQKLIKESIIASRVTHNYPIGFLGGMVCALFTSFAIRNVPIWEWSSELLLIFEKGLIDEYMKTTNIYEKYEKDKNLFFDPWYQYTEEKIQAFKNNSVDFYKFKNRTESLIDYHYYELNGQKGHNFYHGTSGLNSTIVAYDSLLASVISKNYPLDNNSNYKISLQSVIYFSTLHCGDNDTTGAIAGAWYGAMVGFESFDEKKLKQLEFDTKLNKCSQDIISFVKF